MFISVSVRRPCHTFIKQATGIIFWVAMYLWKSVLHTQEFLVLVFVLSWNIIWTFKLNSAIICSECMPAILLIWFQSYVSTLFVRHLSLAVAKNFYLSEILMHFGAIFCFLLKTFFLYFFEKNLFWKSALAFNGNLGCSLKLKNILLRASFFHRQRNRSCDVKPSCHYRFRSR